MHMKGDFKKFIDPTKWFLKVPKVPLIKCNIQVLAEFKNYSSKLQRVRN